MTSSDETRGPARAQVPILEISIAFLVCGGVFAVVNALLGKDLNWDFFNYHRYAALNFYQPRLKQDFFAAGYQGYMNPMAYAPFAWMLHAGWHSLVIGSTLACLHSLNAFFLYLICRAVLVKNQFPRITAALSTVLGCSTGALVSQIGSTFVDPVTTIPVMAGLWLLVQRRNRTLTWLACGFGGFSVALKLTNAPYAVGLYAAFLIQGWSGKNPAKFFFGKTLAGAGCGVATFLIAYAPWGSKLYQTYESPVFPLFNSFFKATNFPDYSVGFSRFIPQNFSDGITLPLRMLSSESWIYTEIQAPDIRPVVLLAGLAIFIGIAGLRSLRPSKEAQGTLISSPKNGRTVLTFFLTALPLWMVTSANGRYAVPLLLLLGLLMVLAWQNALGEAVARIVLGTCLVVQMTAMLLAGSPRWNPTAWTPEWLPASVPQEFKARPHLYITIGPSSESYLAAEVHPESPFINPIGLFSIPTDGPGWNRFIELRNKYKDSIQVVFPPSPSSDNESLRVPLDRYNHLINRLGLRARKSDCKTMEFNNSDDSSQAILPRRTSPRRVLLTCSAEITKTDPEIDRERRQAEGLMNALEEHCPKIFQPPHPQIEGDGVNWARIYGKHDIILSLDFGENRTLRYRQDRQGVQTVVGSVDTATQDINHFACRLPYGGSRGINTLSADESH